MEVIPEGKNFRLVPESELPEILDYLEKCLPESIKFHQTLKLYLDHRIWDFHFYVTKDWPKTPVVLHFPGCTRSPNDNIYQSLGIFCPSNRIECVDLVISEDVLIDWKMPILLNFVHIDIVNRLSDFYIKSNLGSTERLVTDIYCLEKLSELELEELPSDEVEMRLLSVNEAKDIHNLYPGKAVECVELFESSLRKQPGLGVFTKDTNKLAAWMMHFYYGAMSSMHTLPEHRRKGYGIHLARSLTQVILERGYTPFVIIRKDNAASMNLYTKIGYVKAFTTCRIKMTPFEVKG